MTRPRHQVPGIQLKPDDLRELLRVLDEGGVRVFRYEDADIKLEIERHGPHDQPVGPDSDG